jgi:flavin-dependent dehydrogenase
MKYDVIVVGARAAGASTAMLLARAGLDVLLVDRATFPSEIPHGHFIHRSGPARLASWGLLEPVLATGCPAVTTMESDFGDGPLVGTELALDGVPLGLGPRRSRLDDVLVRAAVDAGAELRDAFPVQGYVFENDRVVGIRGAGGVFERGRIIIGADGRGSSLAKAVDAPVTQSAPTATCWYFSYWGGVVDDALRVNLRGDRMVFTFPTNDDLFGVFVAAPIRQLEDARDDIGAHVMEAVDRVPNVSEMVRGGERAERWYGATSLPNFLRRPWGDGWALVGDAGCHKDPWMALGVCDALRDASLLADAIVGERPLAQDERARDEATLPEYHMNLAQALFYPLPGEVIAARAAVRGDAEATREFYVSTRLAPA